MFTSAADARRFVTAGNATFTLSSKRTGARYTYRAKAIEDAPEKLFLSLLSGPDNENDFTYLGLIERGRFRLTGKSKAGFDAPSVLAARYFCNHVLVGDAIPPELEVRHEGRCGRCNRKLTVPESIDRGIGPECFGRV